MEVTSIKLYRRHGNTCRRSSDTTLYYILLICCSLIELGSLYVARCHVTAVASEDSSSCVSVPDRSRHFNGHRSLIEPKGPPPPPSRPPVPITRFSGFVVSCGNRNPAAHFSCTGAAAPLSFICAPAFLCT